MTSNPIIIAFTKVSLPYGWLGNMSPHPVVYNDDTYKTTEALYQALKFAGFPEVQAKIRAEKSPMYAKKVAKQYEHLLNANDTDKATIDRQNIDNMTLCINLKVSQHADLKELLLQTNDAKIIEDCTSRQNGSGLYWGAALINGSWKGKNILGKLWMNKRDTLKGLEVPYRI